MVTTVHMELPSTSWAFGSRNEMKGKGERLDVVGEGAGSQRERSQREKIKGWGQTHGLFPHKVGGIREGNSEKLGGMEIGTRWGGVALGRRG